MIASMVLATVLSSGEQLLQRPEGQVAYEVLGTQGPWVVCVPGMGDVRAQYRFLGQDLVAAGFHVVLMDLRGMGGSTAGFQSYSASAVGSDVVALMDALHMEQATIIGNSMAAAAGVWAAAEQPARVDSLVVIGPFARDMPTPLYLRALMKVLFNPPWGRAAWMKYYSTLYPTRTPADFSAYTSALSESLSKPGHMDALRSMLSSSKADCEARIPAVTARTLVIMGEKDPDFPNPRAEADWVISVLHGQLQMIPGAGHYPHAEMPEPTSKAIIAFLKDAQHGA